MKSVPGPRYRSASGSRSVSATARASRRSRWSRQAATGSARRAGSRRRRAPTGCSTSGSPRTCRAQPSVGAPTPHQLTLWSSVLLPVDLGHLERDRTADALSVEVRQELRLGISRRPQLGVARGRRGHLLQPLGRVRQRLVGPELDHRPPDVLVPVHDVDVGRARAIRLPRQCAYEVGVLDEAVDEDLLSGLHVRADADGKLRVALEAFVHRRRSYVVRFNPSGARAPDSARRPRDRRRRRARCPRRR